MAMEKRTKVMLSELFDFSVSFNSADLKYIYILYTPYYNAYIVMLYSLDLKLFLREHFVEKKKKTKVAYLMLIQLAHPANIVNGDFKSYYNTSLVYVRCACIKFICNK